MAGDALAAGVGVGVALGGSGTSSLRSGYSERYADSDGGDGDGDGVDEYDGMSATYSVSSSQVMTLFRPPSFLGTSYASQTLNAAVPIPFNALRQQQQQQRKKKGKSRKKSGVEKLAQGMQTALSGGAAALKIEGAGPSAGTIYHRSRVSTSATEASNYLSALLQSSISAEGLPRSRYRSGAADTRSVSSSSTGKLSDMYAAVGSLHRGIKRASQAGARHHGPVPMNGIPHNSSQNTLGQSMHSSSRLTNGIASGGGGAGSDTPVATLVRSQSTKTPSFVADALSAINTSASIDLTGSNSSAGADVAVSTHSNSASRELLLQSLARMLGEGGVPVEQQAQALTLLDILGQSAAPDSRVELPVQLLSVRPLAPEAGLGVPLKASADQQRAWETAIRAATQKSAPGGNGESASEPADAAVDKVGEEQGKASALFFDPFAAQRERDKLQLEQRKGSALWALGVAGTAVAVFSNPLSCPLRLTAVTLIVTAKPTASIAASTAELGDDDSTSPTYPTTRTRTNTSVNGAEAARSSSVRILALPRAVDLPPRSEAVAVELTVIPLPPIADGGTARSVGFGQEEVNLRIEGVQVSIHNAVHRILVNSEGIASKQR
jgi:hypothetical protein